MDYLYINAIVKETYTDLPCACPFPEAYRDEIRSLRVINEDCMKNPAIPYVLSYYSVKARDKAPMLVLSQVERHKKSVSVGRFTQHMGWEWSGDLLTSGIDTIIDSAFYSEDEIAEFADSDVQAQLPRQKTAEGATISLELSTQVKSAVLTAVMRRWLRNEPALRIAVPANVDYNQYVLSAVKQLYKVFPVGLRVEAGFCSYMPNVQEAMRRVYIGFIPEEMADPATLFLDGTSQSALNTFSKGTDRESLDRLIQYVSRLEDGARAQFLLGMYQEVEGAGDGVAISGLSAKNYLPTGDAIRMLMLQGDMKSQLKSWMDFFNNIHKYSPSMQANICNHIGKTVQPEEFLAYFKKECEGDRSVKEILDKLRIHQMFDRCNPELGEGMWNVALEALCNQNIGFIKIDQEVFRLRAKLTVIATDDRMQKLFTAAVKEKLVQMDAQELKKDEQIKELRSQVEQLKKEIEERQTANAELLLAAVAEFAAKLSDKHTAMTLGNFRERADKLLKTTTIRYSDMENAINQASKLLQEMQAQPASPELAELIQIMGNFLDKKKQEAGNEWAAVSKLSEIIDRTDSYFDILDKMAREDQSKLDDKKKREIKQKILQKRPQSYGQYERAFVAKYNAPMTLEVISAMPAYVCKAITTDICEMDAITVVYTEGVDLNALQAEVKQLKAVAKKVKNGGQVGVEINGCPYPEDQFELLLQGKKSDKFELKPDAIVYGVISLAQYGAYDKKKNALLNVVDLFLDQQCDLMELVKAMFRGDFATVKPKEYQAAFGKIIDSAKKNIGRKEMVALIKEAADSVETRDRKADAGFNAAVKKLKSSKKKKKLLIPILIAVLAVILAGLLVVAGIIVVPKLLAKDEPEATEPQVTEPVDTQPEEEPVVLTDDEKFFRDNGEKIQQLLVDSNFAACSQQADVLQDIEAADQTELLNIYKENQGKTIDVDGKTVAWEEYFFWVCYENHKAKASGLAMILKGEVYDPKAMQDLSVIYYKAEPVGGLSAENVPDTLSEAWTAAAEAAKTGYEAAKAEPSVPQLMVELYGTDMKKAYSDFVSVIGDFLKKEGINSAALAAHYREGTSALFEGLKVPASWDEYVFWELWVLNRENVDAITAETFSQDLHNQVAEVLGVIYAGQSGEPNKGEKKDAEALGEKLTGVDPTAGTDENASNEQSQIFGAAQAGYTNVQAALKSKMEKAEKQEAAQQETEATQQETEAAPAE